MNALLNNVMREVGTTDPVPAARAEREPKGRPKHYKAICISMCTRDRDALDANVAELKKRGFTKANKSQLRRAALRRLPNNDLSSDPEVDITSVLELA